jgi:ribose transport system permease protein
MKSAVDRVLSGPTIRLVLALVGIYIIFGLISPNRVFFSPQNLSSIMSSAALMLILASGMTVLIVAGQLDLSIGSQLVLSAVLGAQVMFMLAGQPIAIVLIAGVLTSLAVGIAYGFLNGFLTTRLKIPSFIVTLATLGIGLGIAQLLTSAGGATSKQAPEALVNFGLSRVFGIPSIVLVSLAVVVVVGLVLKYTKFGVHCYAVGSNADAARRSGVNVTRVVIGGFMLMGAMSAIAGLIDISRFSAVSVGTHGSDALTAIAGVIIGGASLYGGRGNMLGTFIGTLIPVVLLQGFVILAVNPYLQNVAIGLVLLLAVAIEQRDRKKSRSRAEAQTASHLTEESGASDSSDGPESPASVTSARSQVPTGRKAT